MRGRSSRFLALVLAAFFFSCGGGQDQPPPTLYALDGFPFDPLQGSAAPRVFIFYRTDCPISNRYAPEIRRLHEEFGPRGIDFRLVLVDPSQPVEEIRQHLAEYSLKIPALRDPEHQWVSRSGVSITPEAALFSPSGRLAYRGRIDDRFIDFGRQRPEPTRLDLEEALEGLLAGDLVSARITDAVGCYISDLRKPL